MSIGAQIARRITALKVNLLRTLSSTSRCPVLEAIEAEVEIIEDSVLARPMTAADIERLYMPRRRRAAFHPIRTAQLPRTGSTKPELLPEFGVFLAQPLGEELLQTRILFFKLHQVLEFVALWYLCGSLLPMIVRLFGYSCFLDSILEARSPTCLVLDIAEFLRPLFCRVNLPSCSHRRGSDSFR